MYIDRFANGSMLGDDAGVSRTDSYNFGRYRRYTTGTPGVRSLKYAGPHALKAPVPFDFKSNTFEDQITRSMQKDGERPMYIDRFANGNMTPPETLGGIGSFMRRQAHSVAQAGRGIVNAYQPIMNPRSTANKILQNGVQVKNMPNATPVVHAPGAWYAKGALYAKGARGTAVSAPGALYAKGTGGLGFDYLMSNNKIYLHGEEYVDGWLTDLTAPVMSIAHDVAGSGLGLVRTAVRTVVPAVVSGITGRPVNVNTAANTQLQIPAGYTQNAAGQLIPVAKDNTLLYVGLGGAALLAVTFMATRKRK
jgi:hypothetical protein